MKKMPASFAKPAKQLGMKKGNVAGWDALRRGDLQEKWEIVDSVKWRADARACVVYTSDAADDALGVTAAVRRRIQKTSKKAQQTDDDEEHKARQR